MNQPKSAAKSLTEATSESKNLPSRRIGFTPDNATNSGGTSDHPAIGTKDWKKWVCPDPDRIISNRDFWSRLENDPETTKLFAGI
jgi:hypothetical protein